MFTDTDLTHPWVQKYRLPIIENMYPHYAYILTLTVPSKELSEMSLIGNPTEEEADLASRYLKYIIQRQHYTSSYLKEMASRELDLEAGFNTMSLLKRKDGTWYYRRSTWTQHLAPMPGENQYTCNSLEELLDYIEIPNVYNGSTRWDDWKKENFASA